MPEAEGMKGCCRSLQGCKNVEVSPCLKDRLPMLQLVFVFRKVKQRLGLVSALCTSVGEWRLGGIFVHL